MRGSRSRYSLYRETLRAAAFRAGVCATRVLRVLAHGVESSEAEKPPTTVHALDLVGFEPVLLDQPGGHADLAGDGRYGFVVRLLFFLFFFTLAFR